MEISGLITEFGLNQRASHLHLKNKSAIPRPTSAVSATITLRSILGKEHLMDWISKVLLQKDGFFLKDIWRITYHSHRKNLEPSVVSLNHLISSSVSSWGIKRRCFLSFNIILGTKNESIMNKVKVSFVLYNINPGKNSP